MLIDVLKDFVRLRDMGLLELLLRDMTTGMNIRWATDTYAKLGAGFAPNDEIPASGIACEHIKPYACREREECTKRKRLYAEVITPLRVVKRMCDIADERWYNREHGFDVLPATGEESAAEHRNWTQYVDLRRMEIACGEAPFLATRYASETGEVIPVEERVGLLDRKLLVVSAHAANVEEWKTWAMRAVRATYGYELQGDNLLIARINILCTVTEHLFHRWGTEPEKVWLETLCDVISRNLWQMDGLRACPPAVQGFATGTEPAAPSCRVFDWDRGTDSCYDSLRKTSREGFAFDTIIGNPPYQATSPGKNKGFSPPIYHLFLEEAFSLADRAVLIHPARFLFRAGSTPKAWNEKMLNDPHFKVVQYASDASEIFSGIEIKGGVAVTCYDRRQQFGAIGLYTPFPELNTIRQKAAPGSVEDSLMSMIYPQNKFDLDRLYVDHPEYKTIIGSEGKDKRFRNNAFEKIPEFTETARSTDDIATCGVVKNRRVLRYLPRKYMAEHENLSKWKVLVTRVNGSGMLGETLSNPLILAPNQAYTQTFIGIGAFDTEREAENCLKYVQTKLCRVMLGLLKVTQDNSRETWRFVPQQDFSLQSDINWNLPLPEIDRQLYAKYGLDEKEIAFIETHAREMNYAERNDPQAA